MSAWIRAHRATVKQIADHIFIQGDICAGRLLCEHAHVLTDQQNLLVLIDDRKSGARPVGILFGDGKLLQGLF